MIPELFTQKLTNTKKAKVRKYVYFVTHGNEGLAIRHGRTSEPAEDQDPPPIIPGDFSEGAVATLLFLAVVSPHNHSFAVNQST